MATVTEDLVNGHSVREARGYTEIDRVFQVDGLTSTQPWLRLLEAINEPDIPLVGEPYPDSSGGPGVGPYTKYTRCIAMTREAFPVGCDSARVVVNYSNEPTSGFDQEIDRGQTLPTADVKQITVGLTNKEVFRDVDGLPMLLTAPPGWDKVGDAYQNTESTAIIGRPVGTIAFERTEMSPVTAYARSAVGRINTLALGTGALYAIGTLKLDRLDSMSDDGGRTWRTSYQFSYDPDGWAHVDSWRRPDGKLPEGSTPQVFLIYKWFDFAVFGLDWDDGQTPI